MALKPMALNTPEAIASAYDGNKKKIADAARMGLVDPTAAVMAGMFIDRMRSAAAAEQRPTSTVADDVLGAAQMPAGVAAAPQQPQQAPDAGVAALPSGIKEMAGGGIVAFDEGGEVPGYAGRDASWVIDPNVQRKRDVEWRLPILLQELKEEQAAGNKDNVEALRREIRRLKPPPTAEGGLYNLFPSAEAATPAPATETTTPAPAAEASTSSPLGRGIKSVFGATPGQEAYQEGYAAYARRIKQLQDEERQLGGLFGLRQQTPAEQSRYNQVKSDLDTLYKAQRNLGPDIEKYGAQQPSTAPAGLPSKPYPLNTTENDQRPSIPYPTGVEQLVTPEKPSVPGATTTSLESPDIPAAPTPVYGSKLPALAKLEPELIKEERPPTPEETMAKKSAARKAAGLDEDFAAKRKEAIAKERAGIKGEFEKDKWLAFADMFAQIAAGTSPNALTNIGAGISKGMPGFAQLRKDMKEKEKLLREREDRVDDLEQARRAGDADAIYSAEEKVNDLNRNIKLHNNKVTNASKEAFWKGTNDFAALAFQQYKLDERQQNELKQRAWETGASTQAQWDRLAAQIKSAEKIESNRAASAEKIAKERADTMRDYRGSQLEMKAAEIRGTVKAEMAPGIRKALKDKYGSNANIDAEVNKQLEAEVQRRLKGFATTGGTDAYPTWNLLPD